MFILYLKAKPNARATALQRAADGRLTVRLKAPAQDGKANARLLACLPGVFGVAKSNATLLIGQTAPSKQMGAERVAEPAGQGAVKAGYRTTPNSTCSVSSHCWW